MTKPKRGLVFARVTSKATGTRSARKGWEYSLSNGTRMFLSSDDLLMGKWYFFEMEEDAFKNLKYVSHYLLETKNGQSLNEDIATMKQLSYDVSRMWTNLERTDEQILAREVGIALTGAGAAGAATSAAAAFGTAVAEECIFTALTGGLSLVFAGGLAYLSYAQYRERVYALQNKIQLLKRFQLRRNLFARSVCRLVPSHYAHLDLFDPQITSIVTRLKAMIKDFDWTKLCQINDDNYEYAYAAN